jgi:hypothetical protein
MDEQLACKGFYVLVCSGTVGEKMNIIFGVETIFSSGGCNNLKVGMAKHFMYNIDVQSSGSNVIWSVMDFNPK